MDPGGQGPDRGLKRRGRHRESLEDGQCSRGSGGWVGRGALHRDGEGLGGSMRPVPEQHPGVTSRTQGGQRTEGKG